MGGFWGFLYFTALAVACASLVLATAARTWHWGHGLVRAVPLAVFVASEMAGVIVVFLRYGRDVVAALPSMGALVFGPPVAVVIFVLVVRRAAVGRTSAST
jgi:hypothetical protein